MLRVIRPYPRKRMQFVMAPLATAGTKPPKKPRPMPCSAWMSWSACTKPKKRFGPNGDWSCTICATASRRYTILMHLHSQGSYPAFVQLGKQIAGKGLCKGLVG
eukprot:6206278-Pleurochrysis_carterae.AAC.1